MRKFFANTVTPVLEIPPGEGVFAIRWTVNGELQGINSVNTRELHGTLDIRRNTDLASTYEIYQVRYEDLAGESFAAGFASIVVSGTRCAGVAP